MTGKQIFGLGCLGCAVYFLAQAKRRNELDRQKEWNESLDRAAIDALNEAAAKTDMNSLITFPQGFSDAVESSGVVNVMEDTMGRPSPRRK